MTRFLKICIIHTQKLMKGVKMCNDIKLFFVGIANSLSSDGYRDIVIAPKKLGTTAKDIHDKRRENYKEIVKRTNGQIEQIKAIS